ALTGAIDSPHVRAVIADDTIESPRQYFAGGVPSLAYLGWHRVLQTDGQGLSEATGIHLLPADLASQGTNALDVLTLDEQLLQRQVPFWHEMVAAETPEAAMWAPMSMRGNYARTCAPLLSVKAKPNLADPIDYWHGFVDEACPQFRADHRLVVSPLGHGDDY